MYEDVEAAMVDGVASKYTMPVTEVATTVLKPSQVTTPRSLHLAQLAGYEKSRSVL